jgi:hypothetical protein
MNSIATFRAECLFDGERVPDLLKALKLNQARNINNANRNDIYSFYIPDGIPLDEIKEQMTALIDNDIRFVDMHRCFQTLHEGYEPNEYYL